MLTRILSGNQIFDFKIFIAKYERYSKAKIKDAKYTQTKNASFISHLSENIAYNLFSFCYVLQLYCWHKVENIWITKLFPYFTIRPHFFLLVFI